MRQIDLIRQMLVGDREPDETINDTVDGNQVPYLRRWFVKKDDEGRRIYLHNFMRSDFERATHDHPWDSTSILLEGSYREYYPNGVHFFVRNKGDIVTRKASDSHRIELIDGKPTWSLFITGPKVREWGFNCSDGWVHHSQFDIATCG